MSGPLDLRPWRDRLASLPELRAVGLAADLAAAQAAPAVRPAAYVVPVSDSPSARAGQGNSVITQNVNATVAIVTAVSSARSSATGAEAAEDIQAIRRAIFDCLIGWIPPGASLGLQYAGGQLSTYGDSTVWFSDRFATSYFVRKEPSA